MPANVTLWGLMQWDDTIFDEIIMPEEFTGNIFDLINCIMLECSELEVVYNDIEFMKLAIKSWSASRQTAWKHYIILNNVEYSPIENTDKHETRSIARDAGEKEENTNTDSNTINYHGLNDINSNGENEHQVSAFDSENYANSTRDISTDKTISDLSETQSNKRTITNNNSKDRKETELETVHAHGNIGITTNQQMMTEEVEFWKWDLYGQIAKEFRQKFCVGVF